MPGLRGSLEKAEGDPNTATLTLSFTRTSDLVPVPIITSFQVYGAETAENWTGQTLSHPMSTILQRQIGKPLVVSITTTLDTFSQTLPAEGQISVADIPIPMCQPCPTYSPPFGPAFGSPYALVTSREERPGDPCQGRLLQDWKYRLSGHNLSPEYAEGRPLKFRMDYLAAKCADIAAQAKQLTHLPALMNQSADAYNQAEHTFESANLQSAQAAEHDMDTAMHNLQIARDTWFTNELPAFPTPIEYLCKNPSLLYPPSATRHSCRRVWRKSKWIALSADNVRPVILMLVRFSTLDTRPETQTMNMV